MLGHFGFSYVGILYLLMLFLPNIIWIINKPEAYSSDGENRILGMFENTGQVLAVCAAVIFSDFNIRPEFPWILWLIISFVFMLMYELYWVRYFRSPKTLSDFYSSFAGIPVAGAALPVIAFFLLGIYGKNIWMLLAAVILGIGHIGIHLEHRKGIGTKR